MRKPEVEKIAHQIYLERTAKGFSGTAEEDWHMAEKRCMQKEYWKKVFNLKEG